MPSLPAHTLRLVLASVLVAAGVPVGTTGIIGIITTGTTVGVIGTVVTALAQGIDLTPIPIGTVVTMITGVIGITVTEHDGGVKWISPAHQRKRRCPC